MKQPRYAFSTLNRTHIFIAINGRVALLYKFIERAVSLNMYGLDYWHKTHDRACGFSATTSGVAPARPKCLALH